MLIFLYTMPRRLLYLINSLNALSNKCLIEYKHLFKYISKNFFCRAPRNILCSAGSGSDNVNYYNNSAFTLIEVLAVVIIISVLFAASQPLIGNSARKAKESVLKNNLCAVRETITRFYKDHERYPAALNELVEKKYIMALPIDPITEKNDSWIVIPSNADVKDVYDIKSGARGVTIEGIEYEKL